MIVRKICLMSVVERLSVARDATARTSEKQHHNFDLAMTPPIEAIMAPSG